MRLYLTDTLVKATQQIPGRGKQASPPQSVPITPTQPMPKVGNPTVSGTAKTQPVSNPPVSGTAKTQPMKTQSRASAGPAVEYDYWSGPGQPPAGGGWEQSPNGAWRRPKGMGGPKIGSAEPDKSAPSSTPKPASWEKYYEDAKPRGSSHGLLQDIEPDPSRDMSKFHGAYQGKTREEIEDISTGRKAGEGWDEPHRPITVATYPEDSGGKKTVLNDGNHRLAAARQAGAENIDVHHIEYDSEGNILSETRGLEPVGNKKAGAYSTLRSTKHTQGAYSTDPSHYPEDSKPIDHYKISQAHETQGYKDGVAGHKKIARERAKDLSPDEHKDLANQLREAGMPDDAAFHDSEAAKNAPKTQVSSAPPPDTDSPETEEKNTNADTRWSEMDEKTKDWDADRHDKASVLHTQDKSGKGDTWERAYHKRQAVKKRKQMFQDDPEGYAAYHEKRLVDHDSKKPEDPGDPPTPPLAGAGKADKSKYRKEQRDFRVAKERHRRKLAQWKDQKKELESQGPAGMAQQVKKDASAKPKKQAEQQAEPQTPNSDVEHAQVMDHSGTAKQLLSNIQSHLDSGELDEDTKNKLTHVSTALQDHANLSSVPEKEHSSQLKELQKLAGEHGKSEYTIEDPGAPVDREEPKQPGVNFARMFATGHRAGMRAGKAAVSAETAGNLAEQAVSYATQGVVSGGHKLLHEDKVADREQKKADAKNKKVDEAAAGKEVSQSSLAQKSLYLDLTKAVNAPNIGSTTLSEERARVKDNASYAKRPVGVASGEAHEPDDPDVGRRWNHEDSESVSAEVESVLEADEEEEEDKAEKSTPSLEILKSIRHRTQEYIASFVPTEVEAEFMVTELGYDPLSVKKGLHHITGSDRHRFNEWAHSRLGTSLAGLLRGYDER